MAPRQFSLRSFLIFSAVASIALVVLIVLQDKETRWNVFMGPFFILRESLMPLTMLMLLLSPLVLVGIGTLLYFREPRPVSVLIFFAFTLVAALDFFGGGRRVEASMVVTFLHAISSFACIAEVITRRLKPHFLTAGLTLQVPLSIWLVKALALGSV